MRSGAFKSLCHIQIYTVKWTYDPIWESIFSVFWASGVLKSIFPDLSAPKEARETKKIHLKFFIQKGLPPTWETTVPPQLLFDIMSNDNKWLLLVQLHAMFFATLVWKYEDLSLNLGKMFKSVIPFNLSSPLSPNLCQWCTNSLSKQSLIWTLGILWKERIFKNWKHNSLFSRLTFLPFQVLLWAW